MSYRQSSLLNLANISQSGGQCYSPTGRKVIMKDLLCSAAMFWSAKLGKEWGRVVHQASTLSLWCFLGGSRPRMRNTMSRPGLLSTNFHGWSSSGLKKWFLPLQSLTNECMNKWVTAKVKLSGRGECCHLFVLHWLNLCFYRRNFHILDRIIVKNSLETYPWTTGMLAA